MNYEVLKSRRLEWCDMQVCGFIRDCSRGEKFTLGMLTSNMFEIQDGNPVVDMTFEEIASYTSCAIKTAKGRCHSLAGKGQPASLSAAGWGWP